jgi:hypothetical protein
MSSTRQRPRRYALRGRARNRLPRLRRAGLSLRRGGRFEDAERLSAQPEPEFNEENASCAYIGSSRRTGAARKFAQTPAAVDGISQLRG